MHRRIPGIRVLPFGGGVNILLLAGGAYLAWEHEQGRHERPNLLCPICWLNRIAPAPQDKSATPGPEQPPEPA